MSDAVLVQFGTGDCAEMLRTSWPLHAAYAQRWGMDFHVEMERLCPQRRPEWEKVLQLKCRLMEYRLVIWLDADTLIENPDVDLRTALDDGADMAMRKLDYHLLGNSIRKLGPFWNSGVIVARNTPATRLFWADVWEQGVITDERCMDRENRDWTDAYRVLREEARVNWVLQGNTTLPVLPQMQELAPRFNSFTEYQVSDAVVQAWHGIPRETTRKRMLQELEKR